MLCYRERVHDGAHRAQLDAHVVCQRRGRLRCIARIVDFVQARGERGLRRRRGHRAVREGERRSMHRDCAAAGTGLLRKGRDLGAHLLLGLQEVQAAARDLELGGKVVPHRAVHKGHRLSVHLRLPELPELKHAPL